MVLMQRGTDTPPLLTGGLQMAAAVAAPIAGVFGSASAERQLLVGFGLMLVTTVGLIGLFIARGRWARRYLWVPLIVESAMFVVFDTGGISIGLTALAAVALGMPRLDGWVRQLRKADAPPNAAVLLPLALLAFPAVVGLLREPSIYDWTFCLATAVAAWSYGRAHRMTLWALRVLYPILGVAVALSGAGWPVGPIAGLAVACSVLAWMPGALRGVRPLEARRVEAKPVFAEMAPPGLMEEIGRDHRGRKQR